MTFPSASAGPPVPQTAGLPLPEATAPPAPEMGGPPPGPGVQAPFPAPPTERDRKRLWITIGIALAVVALCGGGALAGIGGLVYWANQETTTKSRAAVAAYLDAMVRGDYRAAYGEQCSVLRDQETASEFAARHRSDRPLRGYDLGSVSASRTSAGEAFLVDATLHYADGGDGSAQYRVVLDTGDKHLEVCGGTG